MVDFAKAVSTLLVQDRKGVISLISTLYEKKEMKYWTTLRLFNTRVTKNKGSEESKTEQMIALSSSMWC